MILRQIVRLLKVTQFIVHLKFEDWVVKFSADLPAIIEWDMISYKWKMAAIFQNFVQNFQEL